ncbi:MAG: hypothetical protein AAGI17_06820 [Planctomycetota bacterium]
MDHVAIIDPAYVPLILSGEKSIESRLTKSKREPWNSLRAGDRIYFKARGGPYRAAATASRVYRFTLPAEITIEELRARFDNAILGPDSYWDLKRESRYAVLAELSKPRAIDAGPGLVRRPGDRSAWHVIRSVA